MHTQSRGPVFATTLAVLLIAAVAAMVAVATGANVAAGGGQPPLAGHPKAAIAALAVAPVSPKADFVPITPCRIVDTRLGGGAMGDNVTRTFRVGGSTGFSAQGGSTSGCGIPLSATAIAASFTANSPATSGYVRAWPSAIATEPNATVLNYTKGQQSTAGAIVSVSPGTATSLKVRNHHGPVDLAIDVTGYYAPPIQGTFTDSGALYAGNGTLQAYSHTTTGYYAVQADRDLTGCVPVASAYYYAYNVTAYVSGSVVYLELTNDTGALVNYYFHVQVSC